MSPSGVIRVTWRGGIGGDTVSPSGVILVTWGGLLLCGIGGDTVSPSGVIRVTWEFFMWCRGYFGLLPEGLI